MYKSHAAGRITRAIAFAAAAALAATAVSPAIATTGAKQEADAKPEKKAKKFCILREATGTRLTTKICKTRKEWISQEGFDPTAD
jgi:hypothetical protein